MMRTLLLCLFILGLHTAAQAQQKFSVEMTERSVQIDPNVEGLTPTLFGHIKNLTGDSLIVKYVREESLPSQWNTNICFGMLCYASWVSESEYTWAPNEELSLKVIFNTPPSPTGSATMRLKLLTPVNGDSVILNLTATSLPWQPLDCRRLTLFNADDADYVMQRIWVSDSVNFSITPRYPTPTEFYAQSAFDYTLCINPRDGKEYTTKVFYDIGSEIRETSVTLVAPNSASVERYPGAQRLLSTNVIQRGDVVRLLGTESGVAQRLVAVTNAAGMEIGRFTLSASDNSIDLRDIQPGLYVVTVSSDGKQLSTEKLLVL
jgi:hypothetical protein